MLHCRQQAIGDSVCAAGGTSNYQAVLNLDRSFEATCLGKVSSAAVA